MSTTTIKIDIPCALFKSAEEAAIVLHDTPSRNILFKSSLPIAKKTGDRLILDLEIDPAIIGFTWFNVWCVIDGSWTIVFSGVPRVIVLKDGQIAFEINEKCQKENLEQITKADTDFVNDILGDETNKEEFRHPTMIQMAKSLTESVVDWTKAGFKTVSEETLNKRLEICGKCEFWDASGFGGTGKCKKCGCSTQAKLRMSTSACPLDPPKWSAE